MIFQTPFQAEFRAKKLTQITLKKLLKKPSEKQQKTFLILLLLTLHLKQNRF